MTENKAHLCYIWHILKLCMIPRDPCIYVLLGVYKLSKSLISTSAQIHTIFAFSIQRPLAEPIYDNIYKLISVCSLIPSGAAQRGTLELRLNFLCLLIVLSPRAVSFMGMCMYNKNNTIKKE